MSQPDYPARFLSLRQHDPGLDCIEMVSEIKTKQDFDDIHEDIQRNLGRVFMLTSAEIKDGKATLHFTPY